MDHAARKLDRNVEQVKRQIRELDAKLRKDPIDLFGLRYTEAVGLETEPVTLQTEVFSGEIEFPSVRHEDMADPGFQPSVYEVNGAFVDPLTILIAPYCTLLAVKVGHADPDYRVKLDWVRARAKENSRVYLVDPVNDEYYYPNATDLGGEVVAGSPRTGLIAFDPLRRPTDTLEIHFSDVKLRAERGARETFTFVQTDPELPDTIRKHQDQESFSEQLLHGVNEERERVWNEVQQSSGCVIVLVAFGSSLAGLMVLLAVRF